MVFFIEQLRELWSERRRIFWVALGVAWGTLALTMLVAFGNSSLEAIHQTVNNFGENLVRISGGSTTVAHRGAPAGRPIALTIEDAQALREGVVDATGIAVEFSSGGVNPVAYKDARMNVSLSGSDSKFQTLRGMIPQVGGRFLNPTDIREHRRVCFLGHKTKQRIFGDEDAVGKTIQLHDTPYLVIGVRIPAVSISSYNGDDREKITIPYTSFQDIKGWTNPSFLFARIQSPEIKQRAFDSIYQVLGARHHFDSKDQDALDVQDYMAIVDMLDGMLDGSRYFNGIVSFFGLLVAILGVMNVMYVLVEERKKEIGVRMALGALPGHILRERMSEAVLVTLAGGAVGILSCMGLFYVLGSIPLDEDVRAYMGYPQISIELGVIVTLILAAAGCAAGWFPARRAALLDPLEALRED